MVGVGVVLVDVAMAMEAASGEVAVALVMGGVEEWWLVGWLVGGVVVVVG